MEYQRFDRHVLLRLDRGDEVCESVLTVARAEGITLGSLSGIGAAGDIETGVFDEKNREYRRFHYTGEYEINNLTGNLTLREGEPYQHLHVTLTGADGTVSGGHLLKCTVSLTAEIFIEIIDGTVCRRFDPEAGINKIDL